MIQKNQYESQMSDLRVCVTLMRGIDLDIVLVHQFSVLFPIHLIRFRINLPLVLLLSLLLFLPLYSHILRHHIVTFHKLVSLCKSKWIVTIIVNSFNIILLIIKNLLRSGRCKMSTSRDTSIFVALRSTVSR